MCESASPGGLLLLCQKHLLVDAFHGIIEKVGLWAYPRREKGACYGRKGKRVVYPSREEKGAY